MRDKDLHSGHRERMRNKLIYNNDVFIVEHELLEVLLFYCQPRKDTNEVAHRLIKAFGSLQKVFDANPEDLLKIEGVSDKTAAFLKLFPKLFNAYKGVLNRPVVHVENIWDLKNYLRPLLENAENEKLFLIFMDEGGNIFASEEVKNGNAMRVTSSMSDLILSIERKSPHAVALAHNHPHASCKPSQEDVASTIRIKYMLDNLGIELFDHIIFGIDGFCSIMHIVNDLYETMLISMNEAFVKLRADLRVNKIED